MSAALGRDLDLNLLRVFLVVAEEGSVTAAAKRLYLTQPAVSAALKRLTGSVGTPLFDRRGRGIALTARGERLRDATRAHLEPLIAAALSPSIFDPSESARTVRIGLSDASESWLLPALLRTLAREAPRMRLVVLPAQFRSVGPDLASGAVDFAVTVADEMPADIERRPLFSGGFRCLYDPKHACVKKPLSRKAYLAHGHVIVSYNGDLRGIVEDLLGVQRDVRLSVPSFHDIGAIVRGTPLLATVPEMVARGAVRRHRQLRETRLPLDLPGASIELLWPRIRGGDEAIRFVMDRVVRIAGEAYAAG